MSCSISWLSNGHCSLWTPPLSRQVPRNANNITHQLWFCSYWKTLPSNHPRTRYTASPLGPPTQVHHSRSAATILPNCYVDCVRTQRLLWFTCFSLQMFVHTAPLYGLPGSGLPSPSSRGSHEWLKMDFPSLQLHAWCHLRLGAGRDHISRFSSPVTLTLTRWPSYTNLTRMPWRCTKNELLMSRFSRLTALQFYKCIHRSDRKHTPYRFAGSKTTKRETYNS